MCEVLFYGFSNATVATKQRERGWNDKQIPRFAESLFYHVRVIPDNSLTCPETAGSFHSSASRRVAPRDRSTLGRTLST